MKPRFILPLVAIVVIGIALYAGISLFLKNQQPPIPSPVSTSTPPLVITSFEECAQHYPVMESYPEQCNTPDGKHFVRNVGNVLDLNDRIVNYLPQPGDLVTSPLSIEGEARGTWYFEASFPVRLVDASSKTLAQGPAQALGEWMTTEFVPYRGTLSFTLPTSATGTLILTRDDPSGMRVPEELRIPIRFR